jgi:hypothetical protein
MCTLKNSRIGGQENGWNVGANLDSGVGYSIFFDRGSVSVLQQRDLGQAHQRGCCCLQYFIGSVVPGYCRSVVYLSFNRQRPDEGRP